MRSRIGTGRTGTDRTDLLVLAGCFLVSAVLLIVMGDLPVFGDAWGYGYRSASWIADHGMQPVPSGDGRGEQAMGHPTLFFWSWALLMRLLGDTVLVAHIIPAILTALALWGSFRFGRLLGGKAAGLWTAAGLLASPLFLAQSLQPLQDMGFTACAVLALTEYGAGNNTKAAILTALGTAFREQGMLLAASFILVEIARTGFSKPGRILAHLLSPAVFVVTGLGNLAYNGYFLFRNYLGTPSPLEPGWLASRIRFFAGHLLAEDGRWILLTVGIAITLARQARKAPSITAVLLLMTPALLFPPGRLLFLAVMGCAGLLALFREGRMPDPAPLAAALFSLSMILFHVLIVAVAPDPQLNLYRYVLAAYPAVIACTTALVRKKGGIRMLHPIAAVFILTGILSGTRVLHNQPDATPAGLLSVYDFRTAIAIASESGDTVLAPETELPMLQNPSLGFTDRPVPARMVGQGTLSPGTSYILLVPSALQGDADFEDMLSGMLAGETAVSTLADFRRGELLLSLRRLDPVR